jgi:hypothetical protein
MRELKYWLVIKSKQYPGHPFYSLFRNKNNPNHVIWASILYEKKHVYQR